MKNFIFSIILVAGAFLASHAQVSPEYTSALKRMMNASGQDKTFEIVIDQMIDIYKVQMPQVSENQWTAVAVVFRNQGIDRLVDLLAPIYAKHLTIKDLEEITGFYSSTAGSKLAKATPFITAESMQAGAKWGESLGNEFLKALEEIEH